MRNKLIIAWLVSLVALGSASTVRAQLTAGGATQTGTATYPDNDLAYDHVNGVYLHVYAASGRVMGRFVDRNGAVVGAPFQVSSNVSSFAGWNRVAYSTGSNAAVFLVAYSDDRSRIDRAKNIFGQIVRFNGSGGELVGASFGISDASTNAAVAQESGNIAFNPVTNQFLVPWTDSRNGWDVYARLIRTDGTYGSPEVVVAAADTVWQGNSSAAYDWQSDKFCVAFGSEDPVVGQALLFTQAQLLSGSTAEKVGGRVTLAAGGFQDGQNVVYLPEAQKFLVFWRDEQRGASANVIGRLVSPDATVAGASFPIIATPTFDGVPDGDYSWAIRSVLVSSQHDPNYAIAVELDAVGTPKGSVFVGSTVPAGPRGGTFAPKVTAAWDRPQFGLGYVLDYVAGYLDRWNGTAASTPGPHYGGGAPPPPPPPAVAGADFNGDGKPDMVFRNRTTGEVSLWLMNGTTRTSQVALPSITDQNWQIAAAADFNSDGKPDILWRNRSTGQNSVWFMNGTVVSSQVAATSVTDTNWQIAGAGDFNGDRKPDLLWRNRSTGANSVTLLNGLTFVSSVDLPPVADNLWQIAGVGDFNRDNNADILWRHRSTGQNVLWHLNGTSFVSQVTLPTVGNVGWNVGTIADMNGDSKVDLVWRHAETGLNVVWYMDGATFTSQAALPTEADANWALPGLGVASPLPQPRANHKDFNGDGQADLLWRNIETGLNVIWLMNGTTFQSQVVLPALGDASWSAVTTADFSGDGKPDILWRNVSTGENMVWVMNGTAFGSQVPLPTIPDGNWRMMAAADMNADGHVDIIWRNPSTGFNVVWFMNRTAFSSQVLLPSVMDPQWLIVGASDANGDGKPDLFWRNRTTGRNVIWLMDGPVFMSQVSLPDVPDTQWWVGSVADMNGDGSADVVWRNNATGLNVTWLMNGTAFQSQVLLPTVTDTRWWMHRYPIE